LVSGANRGLGKRFAAQLVERGAKVYAAARRPETIDVAGVEPIQLDITDPASVRRAADVATDVTVLVNNAGSSTRASLLAGPIQDVRLEMETHYFGTLDVIRTFVPIIEGNGGGAILNMLSVLSWLHPPASGAYSAAKAAEWPCLMQSGRNWRRAASVLPPCTLATWTPTWPPSRPQIKRPILRSSPALRWMACSRASPRYSPTT
jgi:NAD(P)-dependent dehydrogenase (short-subunit alcohol dehydrogenase family)